jgi:hypothetical protein
MMARAWPRCGVFLVSLLVLACGCSPGGGPARVDRPDAPVSAGGSSESTAPTPTEDPCTGWSCTVAGRVRPSPGHSVTELNETTVTLSQASYCSRTRGAHQVSTAVDGSFEFRDIFFHDTDRIQISARGASGAEGQWDSTGQYCLYCICFASPVEIILESTPGP